MSEKREERGNAVVFEKKMEPRCAYCARGTDLADGNVICRKKGVVTAGYACRAFQYDPLKRVPPKAATPDFSKLSQEDFKL